MEDDFAFFVIGGFDFRVNAQPFGQHVVQTTYIGADGFKRKRTRFGWGSRKDTKRAIVTLKDGHHIDIFGGPQA